MNAEHRKLKVVDSNNRILHYSTRVLVILIAVGAGVLSFDGLAQLSIESGVREELAYVWALVIDGFILVATFATFALKDRTDGDRIKKYYAWVVLAVFVIISIFGNAMHSLPQEENYFLPLWVKIAVNAVPPIALFLAIHLIIIMVSPTADERKTQAAEKKRLEREERMKERKLAAAEKRNEKEALEIEKGAKLAPSSAPVSVPPARPAPQSPTAQKNQTEPSKPADQPPYIPNPSTGTSTTTNTNEDLTKDEALSKLISMLENDEKLPSGREVGEWVGLKERAGQNLLKKAREIWETAAS